MLRPYFVRASALVRHSLLGIRGWYFQIAPLVCFTAYIWGFARRLNYKILCLALACFMVGAGEDSIDAERR